MQSFFKEGFDIISENLHCAFCPWKVSILQHYVASRLRSDELTCLCQVLFTLRLDGRKWETRSLCLFVPYVFIFNFCAVIPLHCREQGHMEV